jgi:tryptophan synthase alpha chain
VSPTGVGLIGSVFAQAKSENRALLIGYLPAGFPTLGESVALVEAMYDGGVDLIEVGLPYSDPLMDGPVIQQAVDQALSNGATPQSVLTVVKAVSELGVVPVVMSYWNPIEQFGIEAFAYELRQAGGAGVITPDLTIEEGQPWIAAAGSQELAPIFLVAPSSTNERISRIAQVTQGFVYAASTMGVTGARDRVSNMAPQLVARVRASTDLPIAVGLGVSNGAQAAEIAKYADGVIVGSAFVKAANAGGVAAVRELAMELAGGVRLAR